MNYIERLLESQFASDELQDYLDRKHSKGNPKLSQKYKVATNSDKNKNVNRRAKGLQDAPNAHRFAVQLNSKLRFNNLNALAEPDGKYRNLIWILATGRTLRSVFKYLNEFLGLEPNNNNIDIGDYQIRIADVSKQGVQQYFVRQNGIEFMKTMDEISKKELHHSLDDLRDLEQQIDKYNQKADELGQKVDDQSQNDDAANSDQEKQDPMTAKQEKSDQDKFDSKRKSDKYRDDVVGYDQKSDATIYKPGSKGWWAQRKEKAKEAGIDPKKWNLDPAAWSITKALKNAN